MIIGLWGIYHFAGLIGWLGNAALDLRIWALARIIKLRGLR